MVVDICSQAGLHTLVLNRIGSKPTPHHDTLRQSGHYFLVYDGDNGNPKQIDANLLLYATDADPAAIDALAAPSVLLITTSVTPSGLETVAPLLARSIERRRDSGAGPVCIIACENLPLNSETLAQHILAHLPDTNSREFFYTKTVFCNTVIDRICSTLRHTPGRLEVPVELFHEWILESPGSPVVALTHLAPHVTFAIDRTEFELYELRKYWSLNALQLAAAAFTYNYAYEHDEMIQYLYQGLQKPTVLENVLALQLDLAAAVWVRALMKNKHTVFSRVTLRDYAALVLRRLHANREDTVSRLLKHEPEDYAVVSPTAGGLSRAMPEGTVARDRHLGRLATLPQFLDRVVERIVGPQLELVAFHQSFGKPCPRLQLDVAMTAIVQAMRRYAQ